ncbi:MAG TPA: MFS transporter [Polyangiaceae bacterium]|nr:MFS transporter [Polyangiaceae bacterium]
MSSNAETEPGLRAGAPAEAPWWRTLSSRHWFVFAVASLAWFFDCLDSQFFNLARDAASDQLLGDRALSTIYAPYTTSVFLLGWAAGGLLFGALGDRHGRARILSWCVLLYSVFTGAGAFAGSFSQFCVFRFLTGCGVGGVFGLAVALVADTLATRARAPALGLFQSLSTWGNVLAGLIGMGIGALGVRQLLPFGLRPWQAIFVVGALPALACVPLLRRVPEPDAWLRARQAGGAHSQAGSYRALLGQAPWSRHAWFGLLACSAGIVGYWGIGNFHPRIVGSIVDLHLGQSGLSASALASEQAFWRSTGLLLQNVGGFAGMMLCAWVAEIWGRRPALCGALLLSFATTLLVFRGLREFSQIYWMLPLMGFGQMGVYSVYAIYLPELFPTRWRSTGTSFCYNGGRIVAASAPFTISRITASLGGNIEAFRSAGQWVSLLLLAGLIALPFLPETREQPLPE